MVSKHILFRLVIMRSDGWDGGERISHEKVLSSENGDRSNNASEGDNPDLTDHQPSLQRRTVLKLGATGILAANVLSLNSLVVSGETESAKELISQWQTAFNEGDIDTLRALYGANPKNSLIPVGDTPRGLDLVLSFDQLAYERGASLEIELEELSAVSSEPVHFRGPATLHTVPMGALDGQVDVKFAETSDGSRITEVSVSIPFEVLMESWGEPGELPQGAVPLTDMDPGETFQGKEGGLYGKYQNVPPLAHQEAAVAALNEIQPRDEEGNPDQYGRIGFLTLGPSNTWDYSSSFFAIARQDSEMASHVRLYNGAEGNFSADSRSWSLCDYPASLLSHKLEQAAFPREQIQVAWYTPHYYHDMSEPIDAVGYAEDIHAYVRKMLPKLKATFPNLEIVYLSGFPYLGYAKTGFGEPMAYAMNLAARSLIRAQIDGDSTLNYDPEQEDGGAPLLLWGPYLWANGETPRSDGLTWSPEDYDERDLAHPSEQGAEKVGELLLAFMKTNKFARSWFLGVEPPAIDDLEAPTSVPTATTTGEAPGLGLGAGLTGIGAGAAYRFYRNRKNEN